MSDKPGGILARIGTPAGASIAADIAALTSVPPIILLPGTCDADMSASTTTIDCLDLAGYGDDYFNGKYWMQILLNANSAGNAPEYEYKQITDYVSTTGVFTCNAFSANVEANDEIAVLHESLPFLKIQEFTTGSGNWTVPVGVKELESVVIVAGGGSGGSALSNAGSGGGGGGEVVVLTNFPVAPLSTIPYVVGAGGTAAAAGDNNGNSGANSSFDGIIAYGGLFGNKGSVHTGGNGGQTAVTGGAGGAGNTAGSNGTQAVTDIILRCGGGGGGGGFNGAGGNSLFAMGGTGTPAGGGGSWGVGASGGGYDVAANSAAANSGGGGSGAYMSTSAAGGNGGSGYIRISWR